MESVFTAFGAEFHEFQPFAFGTFRFPQRVVARQAIFANQKNLFPSHKTFKSSVGILGPQRGFVNIVSHGCTRKQTLLGATRNEQCLERSIGLRLPCSVFYYAFDFLGYLFDDRVGFIIANAL